MKYIRFWTLDSSTLDRRASPAFPLQPLNWSWASPINASTLGWPSFPLIYFRVEVGPAQWMPVLWAGPANANTWLCLEIYYINWRIGKIWVTDWQINTKNGHLWFFRLAHLFPKGLKGPLTGPNLHFTPGSRPSYILSSGRAPAFLQQRFGKVLHFSATLFYKQEIKHSTSLLDVVIAALLFYFLLYMSPDNKVQYYGSNKADQFTLVYVIFFIIEVLYLSLLGTSEVCSFSWELDRSVWTWIGPNNLIGSLVKVLSLAGIRCTSWV